MTTTALSEALAKLRQLKVPNWPAGRILGDIADEIESALASAEPVAWELTCHGTVQQIVRREDVAAERLAYWRTFDPDASCRELVYTHAQPAAKVEAPESIEYPGDYMPPNSCELERLADTVTSTYADGGKDETAMWVGGRLRLLARKIAMMEAELQKLPAPTPASVPDVFREHGNSALAHISNALDDLESSPDQRPVPLLNEAMFHIHAMLTTPEPRNADQ